MVGADDIDFAFPDRIGRYELLLPLGTGGTATVFLASARGIGGFYREVALKLIHAHLRSDREATTELLEEARLAARIRHRNVVPVLEVGEEPGGIFLVLEYVEGESLAALIRAARREAAGVPRRIIARILSDALSGLHEAHELRSEHGDPVELVHRDFSPQNILVGRDGLARLTDFGVAKATGKAIRTKTGVVKGKVGYMSPEQARGHRIDRRCDVWAAGVIAWELLAGRRMYDTSDEVGTLLRLVTEQPTRLSEVVADISPELDEAVAWAITPDLEERCPTADALRVRLEAAFRAGDGLADHEEVSAFVLSLVGERLDRRRKKLPEVQRLRAEMSRLAQDAVDSHPFHSRPELTPSARRPSDLPTAPASRRGAEGPRSQDPSGAFRAAEPTPHSTRSAPARSSPAAAAPPAPDDEFLPHTGADERTYPEPLASRSSLLPALPAPAAPPRAGWVAMGALLAALVGGLVAFALATNLTGVRAGAAEAEADRAADVMAGRAASDESRAQVAGAASAAAALAPAASAGPPAAGTEAAAPPPAAKPSAKVGAGTSGAPRATGTAPRATSTAPPLPTLAADPYGTKTPGK